MRSRHCQPGPVDTRIVLYRMAKHAAAIVVIVLCIKLVALDVIAVKGSQMAPSIMQGDRVLVFRLPYLPVARKLLRPSRGHVLIVSLPHGAAAAGKRGCLRVAGIPGDTVSVDRGVFSNTRDTAFCFYLPGAGVRNEVLPADFSPRDNTPPLRVPGRGDILTLDSSNLFHLFSSLSVIRQENPKSVFTLSAKLLLDDTVSADYFIHDFALYQGPLDSIPDTCRYDWFFWARLKEYLRQMHRDRRVALSYSFFKDGVRVTRYTVRGPFLFLLADSWENGLDSRFFGPVASRRAFGRPIGVLWSSAGPAGERAGLNLKRLGKIVR